MKITRIRIGLLSTKELMLQNRSDHPSDEALPTPPDDENHYWAEAIEDGDKFFYRVDAITVEITEYEFSMVVNNPWLYYFSTALKLHKRIERGAIMTWNDEANIRCLLSYACPQLWSRVAATATPDRRHCKECNRDVHLVRDEKDYFQHVAHGHCVAVPVKPEASSRTGGFLMGSPKQR